ncbi:hypothetical protein LEP1GSC050_1808 [Leptospira broomii serovar Hurstbridge str. 5399]|uniref:Uncharacterized protein n=1 Tax=Leptospira broomii serovar Hurstbridge str. 5399 TaxID=1049789 RepID=T0GPU3_9LEPT|nr:hypothetical protein [Leptospira broomii]EQA47348.1 hypothetical protein LEP1GSC050_1808 [Leptospira broomii serovar Hurstbridge str. 5399]
MTQNILEINPLKPKDITNGQAELFSKTKTEIINENSIVSRPEFEIYHLNYLRSSLPEILSTSPARQMMKFIPLFKEIINPDFHWEQSGYVKPSALPLEHLAFIYFSVSYLTSNISNLHFNAMPEGGIIVEFDLNNKLCVLELFNNGDIIFVDNSGSNEAEIKSLDSDQFLSLLFQQ